MCLKINYFQKIAKTPASLPLEPQLAPPSAIGNSLQRACLRFILLAYYNGISLVLHSCMSQNVIFFLKNFIRLVLENGSKTMFYLSNKSSCLSSLTNLSLLSFILCFFGTSGGIHCRTTYSSSTRLIVNE